MSLPGPDPLTDTWNAQDIGLMGLALEQGRLAAERDAEVPVGAVLVDADGQVLGASGNRTIIDHDPTAHAEIVALREAARALGNYRLPGTRMFVTLEPCAMCAMAMIHARVGEVVFATRDPKTGACGSVFDLLDDPRHNHRIAWREGLFRAEAAGMLSDFFRARRGKSG